jgi:hypothetical protein
LVETGDGQRQTPAVTGTSHRPGGSDRAVRPVERIETARPATRPTVDR